MKIKVRILLFISWGAWVAKTYLGHVELVVGASRLGLVTGEILRRGAALRSIILGVINVAAATGSLLRQDIGFTNEFNFRFFTV